MSDLVEWLTKILDEDEALARAVKPLGEVVVMGGERHSETFGHLRYTVASEDGYPRTLGDPEADRHFARHDPAAVLADIAAKRAIIAECERVYRAKDREYGDSSHDLADAVLDHLATAYASRPGYHFNGWQS